MGDWTGVLRSSNIFSFSLNRAVGEVLWQQEEWLDGQRERDVESVWLGGMLVGMDNAKEIAAGWSGRSPMGTNISNL
jgi:hypothetical protein